MKKIRCCPFCGKNPKRINGYDGYWPAYEIACLNKKCAVRPRLYVSTNLRLKDDEAKKKVAELWNIRA